MRRVFIYNIAHKLYMDPWLAGVLIGDGTCNRGKNRAYAVWIDQHKRNEKVLDEVQKVLQSVGFKTYRYTVPENKSRVLTYSKQLFLEFQSIRKDSAKLFSSLNDDEKKKFIAGFFDAEGTVTDRIVIYNSDVNLLNSIKEFLMEIEIPSHIYRFGKIHGLQIYKKNHVELFLKNVKSIRLIAQVNKHSWLIDRKVFYSQ